MSENNTESTTTNATKSEMAEKQQQQGSSRTSFPTLADFLVLLGIFVVANLIAGVVGLIVGLPHPDMKQLLSDDEAVCTAAQYAVAPFNALFYFISMSLTLVGFIYYRYRRGGVRSIGRFSLRGVSPLLLLWGAVLILSSSVVIEPLLNLLPSPPNVYGRGLWAIVMMVVMAPLFEEVLCRGILIDSARKKWGITGAWLLSSAFFGLIHFDPAVVVNAFVAGLILGFIYIKSGSLWVSILLHALNNAMAYVVMVSFGRSDVMLIELIGNRVFYGVIYLVALTVFILSGYMMLRTLKTQKEVDKIPEQA